VIAIPLHEIQSNLQKLTTAAKTVNELSDQLKEEIAKIEDTLNELNLGITANVRIDNWTDEEGNSGLWRLAYGKEAGRWGFFIEYLAELANRGPDSGTYESWLFKDSPREQRLKAVNYIPSLLASLAKKSGELADTITEKVEYAKGVATHLQGAIAAGRTNQTPSTRPAAKQVREHAVKNFKERHGGEMPNDGEILDEVLAIRGLSAPGSKTQVTK
jgi:uncharacterized phage infection (PIP) family protein YhgE